jgi:hypothetical protein
MKLIFVYKADSGKLNAALDIAHKLLSPATYKCDLCSLTYGPLSEKTVWREFREQSDDELVFYHQDEFESLYTGRFDYPVILEETDGDLRIHLSNEEIGRLKTVEELIARLKSG